MPSGLEQECRPEVSSQLCELGDVLAEVRPGAAVVSDTESAAGVEVAELDSDVGQFPPELSGARCGSENRLGVEQLRADVERQPDRLERLLGRDPLESLLRLGPLEPKLARGRAGREVLVAAAADVGIQPDGDPRGAAKRLRGSGDLVKLLERFDVERADPGLDGRADLVRALADAGEDDPVRRNPCLQALGQLTAGDDVGAEPLVCDDS
jgi:hypothetical protein